jgi:hypothetical protein
MNSPRRRVLRPARPEPSIDHQRQQARTQKIRARLENERASLIRWMGRLKRAFHSVEKLQQRIARIERQLSRQTPVG